MVLYSYIILNLYKIIPIIVTIIFSIVSISPIMPTGSEEIAPLLGIISLSFWIVYKPDLIGWFAVIILGLLNDALYGSMLGVSCLATIVIRLVIIKLLLKTDYINIYITFISICAGLIIWIVVHSMFQTNLYNYYIQIFQFFLSLVISPVIIFFQLFLLKKMSN